ncbi:MAG: hypothetical protein K9W43_08760 [Candidatus Thorarchaeota archaeon]|nr:hypothetical protein [Candidatus Thorarchaeota archaeon]
MQLDTYFQYVYGFFNALSDALQPLGIPFGPGDWFFLIYTAVFIVIIVALVRRSSSGSVIPRGVRQIIASTGDVSAGISGAKKITFVHTPGDALVFLKVEENAIQQALSAIDFYASKGEIDESMHDKLAATYKSRLEAVRSAIAKNEELKEILDTSTAVDRARSDYLRKLAAMSGTAVETEGESAGPPSVGPPGSVATASSGPASSSSGAPSGGPPGGGPPGGGPPGGGPPGGGPPSGGPPGGGPPGGGPPGGGVPSGGPPGGGPPGGGAPSSGLPGAKTPGGGSPGGGAPARSSGGGPKSSLQSEMLAEMERLKALMSGE